MSRPNQFALLGEWRFAPFFWTQFLGAFNDNLYKNALLILIAFQAGSLGISDAGTWINACQALFIVPFFVLSASAGQLADKLEKSRLIRGIKLLEIGIAVCAGLGLLLASLPLMVAALTLLGAQSALFGPVKYAILPQQLHTEELVGGNALVESGTFVAILLGTLAGGVLMAQGAASAALVAGATLAVALLGWLASLRIPRVPAAAPGLEVSWNLARETARCLRFARGKRTVFLSILGISWLWFYGALLLAQLPEYSRAVLGGNEQVVTALLALFSIGTGLGSLACEKLSGGRIELGLVPLGSIGMTVFGLDLWLHTPSTPFGASLGARELFAQPGAWRLGLDLALLGAFGGLYSVPLYALVQSRSEASHRSRVIAANNILNALFMVASAGLAIVALKLGLGIAELILVAAALNAAVALYIYTLVPEFTWRFLIWIWIHLMYRLRKTGLEHLPETGPALLVCNHVSFVDALVIGGLCPRPVRFVMDYRIFRQPLLGWFFRLARTIPIAPRSEAPEVFARAFDEVRRALEAGELVCIFPEGGITRDGELQRFRAGVREILRRAPVAVVPMALRGLWGSFFSRRAGTAMRVPRGILSRIELAVGAPVPPAEATLPLLQARVAALRGDWR